MIPAAAMILPVFASLRENGLSLFECFPYVCPEPVLAK